MEEGILVSHGMLIPLKRLQELGVDPQLILHVGAHEAEEKKYYDEIGWNNVIWVEANPAKVEKLRGMDLEVIQAAAYSHECLLTFHESNLPASSSIYDFDKHREKYGGIFMVKEYEVQAKTIDSFNLQPDFLVLDIQGAELDALKGGVHTLEGVNWIYSEISIERLYKNQALEPELTNWLHNKGYKKVEQKLTKFGWGDALYIKRGA